ncbi:ATP-binding protein [Pigmentiphaga soli]|uniref:histidine kinase n=1 Tax=Pigmentiphaga soli TaxID=1007095 RepID=A0ABP8HCF3_9BURK
MTHSLRARLLAFLLAAIFLAALVQGLVAYQGALAQADEVFDYQLQRTALSLAEGNPILGTAPGDPFGGGSGDVVIQIWTPDGIRLFRSAPNRTLPNRTVLGFSTLEADGATYRVFSLQTRQQVIQVAQDMALRTGMARALALRAVWPIAAIAPLLMLVVWWVVSRSLAPVDRTRRQLAARRPDDLAAVSEAGLPDEVRPLVHELNLLLGRVREAFAAQQRFVSDAAHELRSPLTALTLQVQALQRASDDAARRQAVERLATGIARAAALVEQLLALARQEAGSDAPPAEVDLDAAVRQALSDVLPLAQARRIDLGVVRSDAARVRGHADALAILLRNLLDNAIKYSPESGQVDVSVQADPAGPRVTIEDSGPGIPPEERDRVFDRFYRAASGASAGGSGLGLAIARTIATRHGADILLDRSSTLGGLRATVRFPSNTTPPN